VRLEISSCLVTFHFTISDRNKVSWVIVLKSHSSFALPGGFPENYSDSSIVFVDMLTIFHASCCTKTMMTACLVPVSHYFRSRSLRCVNFEYKSISRHPSLTICINKRKLLLKFTSQKKGYNVRMHKYGDGKKSEKEGSS